MPSQEFFVRMPRGGLRGRGRGRGRGGRRGGRGRSQNRSPAQVTADTENTDINLETNPQDYFTGNVTVEQHYNGQNENRERYAATMAVLQENGVDVAQSK